MANILNNFGLEFLGEDETLLEGFIAHILREGNAITGYSGALSVLKIMGNVEIRVKTKKTNSGKFTVTGFDLHCGNMCVWELQHSGIDISLKSSDDSDCVAIFSKPDTGGMIPVEIITADVLPGLMKDDILTVQMVALPLSISYYSDENEYEDAQPADKTGKKWLMNTGSMAPLSFLYNHQPDRYEQGKEYASDRYVEFTAKVKEVLHGTFKLGEEEHNTFIRCFADTEYGELEFVHTLEQVAEELRGNIRPGAIISGTCILSGDVAINEYEKGIVKDFEHNLRLMRYSLCKGSPQRVSTVLADDAIYETDSTSHKISGHKKILRELNYIRSKSYSTYYATITNPLNSNEYPTGMRCIALSSTDSEDNCESLLFIDTDDSGLISRIKLCKSSGYFFRIDHPNAPMPDPLILAAPDKLTINILDRAKDIGIAEIDTTVISFKESFTDIRTWDNNIQNMIEVFMEDIFPYNEKAFANILGYLFAKSIEYTVNENEKRDNNDTFLIAAFSYPDAFSGKITSTFPHEKHRHLEEAMHIGMQFNDVFEAYVNTYCRDSTEFWTLFRQVGIMVQKLGQLYSHKYIDNN